ncbi:sulfotransferase [Falsihalocynthiibacter sp. BN13B15]|uniref:sulfotransferase n=1 Tax=Falsihalocynthiibacter sp. BN13B15 TaxID=3240871 RepID=UPI00350EA3CB
MHPIDESQPVIFVGGAPRSGTTVTHHLICTSEDTNPYHSEISFILPFIQSYWTGMDNWDNHTKTFFAEPEHFRLHSRHHLELSLAHVSKVFDDPKILTVKDPAMTPYFSEINALLHGRVKFVTTVRHPYNVVRSLQAVNEKSGLVFGVEDVKQCAEVYMSTYHHIDHPGLKDVLFVLRYEDILQESVLDALRAFTGLSDIDPDRLGIHNPDPDAALNENDPWYSPKYHAKIDISNRLSPLDPEFRAIVNEMCRPMMERFDYHDET